MDGDIRYQLVSTDKKKKNKARLVGTAYYGHLPGFPAIDRSGGKHYAHGLRNRPYQRKFDDPDECNATEVPYVFGLSKADALAKISGRGLKTGAIKYQYSASVADGNVIDQNPVYWSAVAAGAPVTSSFLQHSKVDEVVTWPLSPVRQFDPVRYQIHRERAFH